jgi:hypothetical protein
MSAVAALISTVCRCENIDDLSVAHDTNLIVPHAIACRALQISPSLLYKWINHKPTGRDLRRDQLDEQIRRLFTAPGCTYGSSHITRDLCEASWRVLEKHHHGADGRAVPGRTAGQAAAVADAPGP